MLKFYSNGILMPTLLIWTKFRKKCIFIQFNNFSFQAQPSESFPSSFLQVYSFFCFLFFQRKIFYLFAGMCAKQSMICIMFIYGCVCVCAVVVCKGRVFILNKNIVNFHLTLLALCRTIFACVATTKA